MDADGVDGGEAEAVGAADDRIALPFQLTLDRELDAIRDVDRVRGGREARRAHRLHHGHVEIERVQNHMQYTHRDLGGARRTDDEMRLAVLEDDRRHDRTEARLPGSDRAGAARARIEHAHAAVVHKAQARRDDARGHAQRMGHGEAVAVLVEDRDMGRVLGDGASIETLHRAIDAARDLVGQFLGIGLRCQALDRHLHELGVAHVGVLVDRGAFHRLADDAQVLR